MSRGRSDGPDFMSQARTLAGGTREPHIAWSYLKRWATGKGPIAMKAAMVSFLELHGSKPESAAILPEIMNSASRMPMPERKDIIEVANRSFSSLSGFSSPGSIVGRTAGPASLPVSGNRPAFSSAFTMKSAPSAPLAGSGERFLVSRDVGHMTAMRDDIFNISAGLKSQANPKPPASSIQSKQSARENASGMMLRDRFEPVVGSGKSHAIMNSLIDRIRSHGRDELASFGSSGESARRKAVVAVRSKARPKSRARSKSSAKRAPIKKTRRLATKKVRSKTGKRKKR